MQCSLVDSEFAPSICDGQVAGRGLLRLVLPTSVLVSSCRFSWLAAQAQGGMKEAGVRNNLKRALCQLLRVWWQISSILRILPPFFSLHLPKSSLFGNHAGLPLRALLIMVFLLLKCFNFLFFYIISFAVIFSPRLLAIHYLPRPFPLCSFLVSVPSCIVPDGLTHSQGGNHNIQSFLRPQHVQGIPISSPSP